MLFKQLALLSPVAVATSAPIDEEYAKRQFGGFLGSVAGFFGANATYDYVIVGGGTAGLVMVERLFEDPEITNPVIGQTPAGDVLFVGSSPSDTNPAVDWNINTTPQTGASGRTIHYARGKTLGGSSARNFMIYQRGTRQSYQMWADAVGDSSYTFDNLLPYLKKSVQFTPPDTSKRFPNASAEYNTAAFGGTGSPLQVSYANYAQPFSTWIEPSLREIGVPQIQDFNSGSLIGSQYCASTIDPKTETRDSFQTSFLNLAKSRQNLKVYNLSLAKKIIFNSSKEAIGVSLTSDDGLNTYTIDANKEVIVSADAFQSPQLLMVSGLTVLVLVKACKTTSSLGPTWRVNVQTFTRLANDPVYLGAQFAGDYSINKAGPLTSSVCDYLGWEKFPRSLLSAKAQSDLAQFPADWPEMEYLSGSGCIGDFSNLFTTQPKDGYQYATILGGIMAPLSRGIVTLASADTKDLPVVDPNWLTHLTDQEAAVAIFKRVRQAFDAKAMKAVLADTKEYFPGPQVQTDAQILKNVQDAVMTIWHAFCTFRMGKTSDLNAVVDSNAKVIGVTGLRVVDASSFALLVPGHTLREQFTLSRRTLLPRSKQ